MIRERFFDVNFDCQTSNDEIRNLQAISGPEAKILLYYFQSYLKFLLIFIPLTEISSKIPNPSRKLRKDYFKTASFEI